MLVNCEWQNGIEKNFRNDIWNLLQMVIYSISLGRGFDTATSILTDCCHGHCVCRSDQGKNMKNSGRSPDDSSKYIHHSNSTL